jgi:RNA polymerase sigma-70 factor (ECF subfamily)
MINARTQMTQAPRSDKELTTLIGRGDQAAFEQLMRQYNSGLYRIARAILKDDSDAGDAHA